MVFAQSQRKAKTVSENQRWQYFVARFHPESREKAKTLSTKTEGKAKKATSLSFFTGVFEQIISCTRGNTAAYQKLRQRQKVIRPYFI
jgi:hypothetical protein